MSIKFPQNLGKNVVILKANNVIDVFNGTNGWDNHSRFYVRKDRSGVALTQLSGEKLQPSIYKQVLNEVQNAQ